MALHHHISYPSPCSFKDPSHYSLPFITIFLDGGVGFGGGPDGSSSSHVISFPTFFQTSMSLPFTGGGGGFFSWGVPMALHYYMSYSFPMFFQRSMSLPFKGGGWFLFWGGFPMALHHYMSYSFPMFFQRSMSLPFKGGGWFLFWGGSRWLFIITCHILPHVLSKIHVLTI